LQEVAKITNTVKIKKNDYRIFNLKSNKSAVIPAKAGIPSYAGIAGRSPQ
jgi:hypothetical protein